MDTSQHSRLQVTAYDRFQGSLVSAIVVFGFLFATLFAIWWSQNYSERPSYGGDFRPVKQRPRTDVSFDNIEMNVDEFPPTAASRLSSDIAAVSNIVSSITANELISLVDGVENSEGSLEIGPLGFGGGPRIPGFPDTISESKRWSVVYQNPDFDDYVKMLRFFKVDVGVVRLKSNEVIRIKNPGLDFQVTQSERAAEKTTFYFHNTKSAAQRWDAKIVNDADIDFGNSAVVHFYAEQALKKLRAAETNQVFEDGKTVKEILTTKFAIFPTESGFEFRVHEITYR